MLLTVRLLQSPEASNTQRFQCQLAHMRAVCVQPLTPMSVTSLFLCIQERNTEVREEVHFLEQRRLEEWEPSAGQQRSSSKPSAQRVGCAAASQPKLSSATPRTGGAAAAGHGVPPAPAARRERSPELAGQVASGARSGGGSQHEQQASGQQAAAHQTAAAGTAGRQAAGRGSKAQAPSQAPQVRNSSLPAGDGCNHGEREAADAEAGYAFDAGQEGGWRDDDDNDCNAPDFTVDQQGADGVLHSRALPLTSLSSQQQRQWQSDAGMKGLALSQAGAVRGCQGAGWAAGAPLQSLKRWRADAAVPGRPATPERGTAGGSPTHAGPRQPASQGRHIWPAAGPPQVEAEDWEAHGGHPDAHPPPAAQGEPQLADGGQSPDAAAIPATFSWRPLASREGTWQQGQLPLRPQQLAWSEHEAGAEAQPSSWGREQGMPRAAHQGSGYNERLEGPAGTRSQHASDEQAQASQPDVHRRREDAVAGGGGRSGGPAGRLLPRCGPGQPDSKAQEARSQHQQRAATDWQGWGQPGSRAHESQSHDQEWASADWKGLGQFDRQGQQQEWAAALPSAAGPAGQAGGGWHGYSHASEPGAEVAGSLRGPDSLAAGAGAEQASLWQQNDVVQKEQSQAAAWQDTAAARGEAAGQQVQEVQKCGLYVLAGLRCWQQGPSIWGSGQACTAVQAHQQ